MSERMSRTKTRRWLGWGTLLLLASIMAAGDGKNICDESIDSISQQTYSQATPKGGLEAGRYQKDDSANSLEKCFNSCCANVVTCDSMFYYNGECFLIQCNKTNPDACDPEYRKGEKFENTYLIKVNTNGLHASSPSSKPLDASDVHNLYDKVHIRTDCSEETGDGCALNEDCNFVAEDEVVGYICQCRRGYVLHPRLRWCVDERTVTSTTIGVSSRPADQSCTYALEGECQRNEECTPQNSRSRVGRCLCVEGFIRDKNTGWCIISQDSPIKSTTTTIGPGATTTTTPVVSSGSAPTTSNSVTTTTNKPTTVSSKSAAAAGSNQGNTSSTLPGKSTTTTEPMEVKPLVVSAGKEKIIKLPENEITLSAYVLPAEEKPGEYKYTWSLMTHPAGDQVGQMQGINTATLKLSKLIVGVYTFKVAVSAEGKYGEALVNVTVNDVARKNKPPVSIIQPKTQTVNEPNDIVLDGSLSTDDDQIVKYHWDQVSGPLNSKNVKDAEMERQMLVIKGLAPGKYRFKLTVTDSDQVENSTFANVTVIKEMDYPPKANAGSNVILSLPQNSVTLYGNASTDDKGISSYEWIKKSDDKLTADMTGTRSAFLHLENLEVGDYTFTLKVTDTTGQTSSADVHVFVKPEHNKPPKARAGKVKTVWLPLSSTTLDGSNSTDDQAISSYSWKQISGPSTITINNADRAIATASKLVAGEYKFRLLVVDVEGLQSSNIVTITVKENENHPPMANAGGDKAVKLPITVVQLDGSASSDDKAIVSYRWTRDEKSLAAGDVLNGSDHSAVLQLTNVITGRYIFTLEVVDAEGLSSTDSASVIVKEDPLINDIVELHLEADIETFTVANKRSLTNQLALLLHKTTQDGMVEVVVQHLYDMPNTGQLSVTFYVKTITNTKQVIQKGTDVVAALKKKLRTDSDMIDYRIKLLDTLVCHNNCSGHGHCDSHTKRCTCEAFWMENIFSVLLLQGESNCDWSILYVIIVTFIVVVGLAGIIWGIVCLCRKSVQSTICFRWRPKKRHRYTLLDELEEDKDNVEMIPRGKRRPINGLAREYMRKIQNSSLMISESDFSSDGETLFVNHKKPNGHIKNGLVKPKSKIKT